MEPFLAEIVMFGGNFAPRGWAFCNGQLLAISQNQALFSLLGTTYGGDGRTTFALPDLRGRAPIHPGTGPGLTTRRLGQRSGTEINTLTTLNLPSHTHAAAFTQTSGVAFTPAYEDNGNTDEPGGHALAIPDLTGTNNHIYSSETPDANLAAGEVTVTGNVTVGLAGSQQPVNNMQPFLGVYYIIALVGTFPSRS